jgi:hypothetical protein
MRRVLKATLVKPTHSKNKTIWPMERESNQQLRLTYHGGGNSAVRHALCLWTGVGGEHPYEQPDRSQISPAMSTGTPVRSGPVQSGRCRAKTAHAQSPRPAQMRCAWLPERQRLEFRAFVSPSRRTIRPRARQRISLPRYSTTGWAVFHILAIRDPVSRGALRTGISTQASPTTTLTGGAVTVRPTRQRR